MFGFRAHHSARDVLLQIKEEVLDHLSSTTPRVIPAIDVKGTCPISHFDNLTSLQNTNCGLNTYNYVKQFLTHRAAKIGTGPPQKAHHRGPSHPHYCSILPFPAYHPSTTPDLICIMLSTPTI